MAFPGFSDNDEVGSGASRSCDHSRDRCNRPPFPVGVYIGQHGGRLNYKRVFEMYLAGDGRNIRNICLRRLWDTTVRACMKQ